MQIHTAFNQLKIRNKLRLFLFIPIITLLFFAVSELLDNYRGWSDAQTGHRFFSVSVKWSSLLHALQKERDITAVFFYDSDGSVQAALHAQRQRVDELLSEYHLYQNRHAEIFLADSISHLSTEINTAFDNVSLIRRSVDNSQFKQALRLYGELNAQILASILQIQLQAQNVDVSRLARVHNILLNFEENAALERAALMDQIGKPAFDALQFSQIASYIAIQRSDLKKYFFIAPLSYQEALQTHVGAPANDAFNQIRQSVLHYAEKKIALNEMQTMFGDRQLKRRFKNYIIHGTEDAAGQFKQCFQGASQAFINYRNLPGLTKQDQSLLATIESALKRYNDEFNVVRQMRAQAIPSSEINRQLDIDDTAALAAIEQLDRFAIADDNKEWWKLASRRIDSIREVTGLVEADLLKLTSHRQSNAIKRFTAYLLLTGVALFVSLLLARHIKRRLEVDIVDISNKLHSISQYVDSARQLPVEGTDEIADMLKSFNNVLFALKGVEQKLRDSEENYRLISTLLPQQIWTALPDGKLDFVNQRVVDYFGVPAEQLLGDGWQRVLHPDDLPNCRKLWKQSLQSASNYEVEFRLKHHSGVYHYHLGRAIPQFDSQHNVIKWFGSNTNISEQKQAEEKLKLAARVFSHAHEGIMITDAQPAILDINPVFTEITGFTLKEVFGENPNMLSSGLQTPDFYSDMWLNLKEKGYWKGELWNRKKNGQTYAALMTISSVYDDEGNVQNYIGLFSDITQIKQQQQALERMAHFDVLTRLPNRSLFADRFHQAIARSKRDNSLLAVVFLDLDGFKPINDQFGHEVGDQVLIEVAQRINRTLREDDTVSRLGGDEFALLLSHIESQEQCKGILSRLNFAINQPFPLNGHSVDIGASCGVTLYPLDDADPDTLLRHADHAMYQAKLEGKNRCHFFDCNADQQIAHKQRRLKDIEQAFKRQEFCLYYQPKVDMKTGQVCGVEALLRWEHPQHGIILPGNFLPIIEDSELEIRIGQWVLESAIGQLERWTNEGLILEISINVSSRHLLHDQFIEQLQTILRRHPKAQPEYLQLEILESGALDDLDSVNHVINTLAETLHIKIALDDFGTGYSSLTHLRYLLVNTVKIDQGFVRSMIDDPNDFTIIEGVISLTKALHREVIAEGVESTEHGLLLLMLGCHLAQGFGISKPLPASALAEWSATYRCPDEWRTLANNPLSEQVAALRLLSIVDHKWLTRLQNCLQSPPHTIPDWPILSFPMCHCGRWFKLAKTQDFYVEEELETLEKLHKKLHHIGNRSINHFIAGDSSLVRTSIKELQDTFAEIDQILKNPGDLLKTNFNLN